MVVSRWAVWPSGRVQVADAVGCHRENTRAQIFESALLCGFDWVLAQGGRIDVANLSLGIKARVRGDCGTEVNPSGNVRVVDPLHAAVRAANEAGVTVVAAAGNDAYDAERQLPAAYPEAVAVSAFVETDGQVGGDGPPPTCLPDAQDDHLAYFSNYGAVIELAAPGVCIPSTLPTDPTGAPLYANVSGTSFAAPHVARAAALVRAQHPDYSPDQVRQRLQVVAAHDPLPGDPGGITEPILDLRDL
jgi:subtilisin family serine protease